MEHDPSRSLRDEDMETVRTGSRSGPRVQDADGTDQADDADSQDADGTDSQDSGDSQDADSTDSQDSGDSRDS